MSEHPAEIDALALVIEAHWWPRGQVPHTPSGPSYNIARLVIGAGYVRPATANLAPFATSDGVNFRRVTLAEQMDAADESDEARWAEIDAMDVEEES